jgi:hypothetical protein
MLRRWPLRLLHQGKLSKISSDQFIDVQLNFWSSEIELLTKLAVNYQVNDEVNGNLNELKYSKMSRQYKF